MERTPGERTPGERAPADAYRLDPRIASASAWLADLGLCEARLQDDARWPWIVLVPRLPGLREVEDLEFDDRGRLLAEAVAAGRAVRALGLARGRPVAKLNLGALGNITPQLHLHVIGRRTDDPAWPGPAWGAGQPVPYGRDALAEALQACRPALTG